jgi:DNA-binding transcriptional LysR family regulator
MPKALLFLSVLKEQGAGVAVLPLDPPQLVDIGIALPRIDNSSPTLKKFVEFIEQRLTEYPLTTR